MADLTRKQESKRLHRQLTKAGVGRGKDGNKLGLRKRQAMKSAASR